MKKLIRRCPICNNEYGEVYKTIKMKLPQDVRLPDEYDVVTCEKCGFAYADVDATQDTYNTYYVYSGSNKWDCWIYRYDFRTRASGITIIESLWNRHCI